MVNFVRVHRVNVYTREDGEERGTLSINSKNIMQRDEST